MAEEKRKRRSRSEIAAEYGTTVKPIEPGQSELDYYRQLAKQADQRLVRLEQAAGVYVATKGKAKGKAYEAKEGFESVLSFSYRQAMHDIQTLSGRGDATRFNTITKKTKAGKVNQTLLHAKINAVKRFLEAPTSMVSTIEQMYQKRADKLNEQYGTNFTWQEMGRFFESAAYEKLIGALRDSGTILKAFAKMTKTVDVEDVKKRSEQNIRVREDRVVSEVARVMKDQQLTLKDFGL